MDVYKEIMAEILQKEDIQVEFKNCSIDPAEIVNSVCYRAICEITNILQDDSLDDKECFMKIEHIVKIVESLGINCGNRHDFG